MTRLDVVFPDGRRYSTCKVRQEGAWVTTNFGSFKWFANAWRWVRDDKVTLDLAPPA